MHMRNILIMIISLVLLSSCSGSSKLEAETCDLSEYKQVMDEMGNGGEFVIQGRAESI